MRRQQFVLEWEFRKFHFPMGVRALFSRAKKQVGLSIIALCC